MVDRPRVAWRRTIVAALVGGSAMTVVIYLVRLALGETQFDAGVGAIASGVGLAIATILIAVLARSPSSVYAIAPELETAIFTRKVPDDVDAARWLTVLMRSRRIERVCAWVAPPVILAIAVALWVWAEDSASPVAFRVAAVLFAAAAIGAPFFLRWELHRMDDIARELKSRLPD